MLVRQSTVLGGCCWQWDDLLRRAPGAALGLAECPWHCNKAHGASRGSLPWRAGTEKFSFQLVHKVFYFRQCVSESFCNSSKLERLREERWSRSLLSHMSWCLKMSPSSPWILVTVFPFSLYLIHQLHLYSHLLSPSTATLHPTFMQVNLPWVMKSNLLLSLGTLLLNPFTELFFLFKAGGIFSFFQSLLPHTAQVLLTFLTSFPSHDSHCSLPDHHSPTCRLSVYWSGLLSFTAKHLDSG